MAEKHLYVDKERYDKLLKMYFKLRDEHAALDVCWDQMKYMSQHFSDQVLENIHQFETIEEEHAYLMGAFNAFLAVGHDMKDLERRMLL